MFPLLRLPSIYRQIGSTNVFLDKAETQDRLIVLGITTLRFSIPARKMYHCLHLHLSLLSKGFIPLGVKEKKIYKFISRRSAGFEPALMH